MQGIWVRLTAERLPVAGGPASGVAGAASGVAGAGPGAALRVAVIGESTAAGVGVREHGDGFAGCLARELAGRAGRPVEWAVAGEHGANARRIHEALLPLVAPDLDVVVLLAGVNDALEGRAPRRWGEDLALLAGSLAVRAKHVVVPGIPAFTLFPSLPRALGRYLTRRAAALDLVSREVCAAQPRVSWLDTLAIEPVTPDFFASDGFHPSAAGYRRWAEAVADQLGDSIA
jgi:lysophospholipase L1-like esterase